MTVSVLIPYAGNDRHRQLALKRTVSHYLEHGWEVSIGTTTGPWCKARAVHDAATNATGDLYVIADADCLCDDTPLAITAVREGAPWAMPHYSVRRLTQDGKTEQHHQGVRGGGIVALPRSTYEDIPLDPRFNGWGHEDLSWSLALDCLAGPCARGDATLTHLWHPPQERATRRIGSEHGRQLERLYWKARTDPAAMRMLIDEAKEAM